MRVIRAPYRKVDLSIKFKTVSEGPRLWKADHRRLLRGR
jgi:hypothetical protein